MAEKKRLAALLAEVAAECRFAEFDKVNDYHKYRYASAASIISKVNVALTQRGIATAVASELLHFTPGHAVVRLTLSFTNGEEIISAQGIGEGTDKGDKAVYKANTGAYKYAIAHALNMAWGADDPEADASTDARTSAPPQAVADKPKTPAKRGRPKATKSEAPAEPKTDNLELVLRIGSAKTAEELAALKKTIVEELTRGSEEYTRAVAAWKTQEASLRG